MKPEKKGYCSVDYWITDPFFCDRIYRHLRDEYGTREYEIWGFYSDYSWGFPLNEECMNGEYSHRRDLMTRT